MPKTYADIPYGEKPAQKLDIIVGESDKTVVYIHGGGLTGGDKKTDFPLIKELSKKGYSIVSVGYTLYPEAKFPDFINDCALVLRFIVDNAEKYGYGDKISIVGRLYYADAVFRRKISFGGRADNFRFRRFSFRQRPTYDAF